MQLHGALNAISTLQQLTRRRTRVGNLTTCNVRNAKAACDGATSKDAMARHANGNQTECPARVRSKGGPQSRLPALHRYAIN